MLEKLSEVGKGNVYLEFREDDASENVALAVHVEERRGDEDARLAPLSTTCDVRVLLVLLLGTLNRKISRT